MGMIRNGTGNIQAFPLHIGTNVFASGVTGFPIKSGSILHLNADSDITLNFKDGSTVSVSQAIAGSDFAIGDHVVGLDVSGACMIS